jgi:aryl-alcohol dehydrogenase-like predicted oxidoreductase
MNTPTTKRLGQALAEIEALRRRESHDAQAGELIAARVDEFAQVSGRTVIQVVLSWLRQGSPYRDPRPASMLDVGHPRESAPRRIET